MAPESCCKTTALTSSRAAPTIGPDGTLYASSVDNSMYALNAESGAVLWHFPTSSGMTASATVANDGTVFIAANDNNVYAVSATGGLKWSFATGAFISAPVTLSRNGSVVYITSTDVSVYAVNASNGFFLWGFMASSGIYTSATVGNDGVFVGADNLYALSADIGTDLWSLDTQPCSTASVGLDGTVYAVDVNNNAYALNGTTGAVKWNVNLGSNVEVTCASPIVAPNGIVLMGCGDNSLSAMNASNGVTLWSVTFADALYNDVAVTADGSLFAVTGDNVLHKLVRV